MPPAKVCPPERLQKRPLPAIRIRPDDVFIVSYPRSGNTWVRFLIANLLAPDEKITFRNIENYVPSIYKSADTLDTREGRRYIKSHNPCYELYPKLIYVYRDGRDALVSYYYYAMGKNVFSGTFEDFIFSPFVEQFTSWKEHITRAREFASKYPDRILILRYEEMLISTFLLSPAYPRFWVWRVTLKLLLKQQRKAPSNICRRWSKNQEAKHLARSSPSFEPAQAINGEITLFRNCTSSFYGKTSKRCGVWAIGSSQDLTR